MIFFQFRCYWHSPYWHSTANHRCARIFLPVKHFSGFGYILFFFSEGSTASLANPGPTFETYQPHRAKFAARNSGTNTAVYNFSRFQLTIRQNRGIRCIGQLGIVKSAAYSVSSGFHDSELTNAANSAILPYRQLKSREIIHCGISP